MLNVAKSLPVLIAGAAVFCSAAPCALAGDISVYGGRKSSNSDPFTTVAISGGADVLPITPGISMQVRVDASLAFLELDQVTVTPFPNSPSNPNSFTVSGHVDNRSYAFRAGPAIRFDRLPGPFVLTVGAQAGARLRRDKVEAPAIFPGQIGFRDTKFDYQFPAELALPISKRFSVAARYRAVNNPSFSELTFDHVVEGGLKVHF